MKNYYLKPVVNSDIKFLYDLLKERDPSANISHKKIPIYAQHKKFVMSKPYSKWYIIEYNRKKIGSIYLSKQNEIGIFLKKEFHALGLAYEALKLIMKKNPRKRFLANVSPKNKKSMKFFKQNNFQLIQYTYEYEPRKNKTK